MVISMRTAGISEGALAREAFGWALQIAQYINAHIDGIEVHVYRNVGGGVYEIIWIATYESLAAFEQAWAAMEVDEGYNNMLEHSRAAGFFAAESIHDQLFHRVG
jgi:hypothetical protein